MGKALFGLSIVGGIFIIIIGLATLAIGLFDMPMIFAGGVLVFAIILIVLGAFVIWCGKRSMRPKVAKLTEDEWKRLNQ